MLEAHLKQYASSGNMPGYSLGSGSCSARVICPVAVTKAIRYGRLVYPEGIDAHPPQWRFLGIEAIRTHGEYPAGQADHARTCCCDALRQRRSCHTRGALRQQSVAADAAGLFGIGRPLAMPFPVWHRPMCSRTMSWPSAFEPPNQAHGGEPKSTDEKGRLVIRRQCSSAPL